MAYTKTKKLGNKSGPIVNERIHTTDSVLKLIKETQELSKFFELEPLEVLEVLVDTDKPSFPLDEDGNPDYQYIGAVIGRYCVSEQGLPIDECGIFKPINPSMNITPIVGEILVGMKVVGNDFYMSPVNLFGNPSFNTQHGISKLKSKGTLVGETKTAADGDENSTNLGYYIDRDTNLNDPRRVLPSEGDLVIEGRFGNSIRLGSDIKNEENPNRDISPNIILNVGQTKEGNEKEPVVENADTDGSSIYLTTNQELKFTPPIDSKVLVQPYEGNSVLVSSDRIVFNAKNSGNIGLLAQGSVAIGAVTEVVIESPIVKVGDKDAEEQMILGTTLVDRLIALVDAIGNVTGIATPTGPTPGPINAATVGWATPGGVEDAKGALIDALSELHRIDK